MRVLFLDDDETRHEIFAALGSKLGMDVTHVRTVDQALRALRDSFDIASLDHDLGQKQHTESDGDSGYAVAQAIASGAVRLPGRVVVHSWNHLGAKRMVAVLSDAGVPVVHKTFGHGL